jgi:HD-GYP domain-containing protein (c-di-GMP phosphodiesterase class II)
VRAAVLVVPAVCGAGAGIALGRGLSGRIVPALATAVALGVSALVAVGVETLARRLLPLAALLKLSLAFPDRAPSRFRVARQAGNTRVLRDRVAHARAAGVADDPARAAEEILGLVAALAAHDRKTRGHSERVRGFTDLLADELAIPQADRDRLRWAALLHDIGKLEVPAATLNKAGKPDPKEWEQLKRHPLEGQRIVGGLLPWLESWGAVIAQHHERFDGAGYPNGLAGEQIHLGARIVSVADSFEVMTAARSYKRPMTPPAARRELAACAGKQFDPMVVRAMFSISLGRLWWRVGPASWIAQVPFMLGIGRAGSEAVAVVRTGSEVAARAVSALLAVTLSGATGAARPPLAPTTTAPKSGVRTLAVRAEAAANAIPAVSGKTIDRREPPPADDGEAPPGKTDADDSTASAATATPEPQSTPALSVDAGGSPTDATGAAVTTATDAVSDTTRTVSDRVKDATGSVSEVAASPTPAVDATLDQATKTVADTTTTVTDTTTTVAKDALAALQPPTDTSGLLGR